MPVAPIRILLLEDSDIDAELLVSHLERAQLRFELVRARRRQEYVDALVTHGHELDIVLADYSLPDFDGLTALTMMRETRADLPFIFVSGVVGEDFATDALKQGAIDYILKRNLGRLPKAVERAMAETGEREKRRRIEAALRETEARLRQANETLEVRIAERTRELRARTDELADTNRELVRQIRERREVEDTLNQMQRLEAVGQLTSGVAHDFNNLLTVVLTNLSLIERSVTQQRADPKLPQRLASMRDAAERGAKLTAQLLAFARRQRLEPKPLDLNETVNGMRSLLESTVGGSVRIETELAGDLWTALVDPTQIGLVILNLAINARDAMEVGGSLKVRTANIVLGSGSSGAVFDSGLAQGSTRRAEEPGPGEYVLLSVTDTGTGMTDEVLARALEPFFTTKEIGKGSGLGLAQVYGFAKQSGGGVSILTTPGKGTSVQVFLPRAPVGGAMSADRTYDGAPMAPCVSGDCTVLLLDDDAAVRTVTADMLRELGYSVVQAGTGPAALALLRETPGIDMLVADFAMPGMNGVAVAREARLHRPDLPVLFVTGYADLTSLQGVTEEQILQKPFSEPELALKLRRALAAAERASDRPASIESAS